MIESRKGASQTRHIYSKGRTTYPVYHIYVAYTSCSICKCIKALVMGPILIQPVIL